MAKEKNTNEAAEQEPRESRRERLLKRRQAEKMRQLRLGAWIVLGLIGLIIVAGIVVEFLVVPNQAVAEVGSGEVSLSEWQEMVKFQRAQLIAAVESQYEDFLGDVENPTVDEQQQALRFVQQFSGQQIVLLGQQYEQLGEFVLDQMIDDELTRQGAAERGITVTEEEIDARIGERYNFFDGESPTPFPTATQGPEPTPSITPIGFEAPIIPEATPTTAAEPLPTNTPPPTATPVSRESFEEQLEEDLQNIADAGGNSALFRQIATQSIYREKMAEALFAESDIPTRVPHTSAFFLIYGDPLEAEAALGEIETDGFLTVWNTARSQPPDIESIEGTALPAVQATERLFLSERQYGNFFPSEVVDEVFSLTPGETSGVITGFDMQTGAPAYYIVQVSGREERDLDRFTIQQLQGEALEAWLAEERAAKVTVYENWRTRVPRTPILEQFYRDPVPTVTPQPTVES